MGRRPKTLLAHEVEVLSRMEALAQAIDNPHAPLPELRQVATRLASGCTAYADRLLVASPSERRAP